MAPAGEEDSTEGINHLVNLYLQAFYCYHFLSQILQQDESLQDYSRKYSYSSNIAKCNAQVLMDYLGRNGHGFIIAEPPNLLEFNMKKAAELDRTIRHCIRRLEKMATRDANEELLAILRSEKSNSDAKQAAQVQVTERRMVKETYRYLERKVQLTQTVSYPKNSLEEKGAENTGEKNDDGQTTPAVSQSADPLSQSQKSADVEQSQNQPLPPEDNEKIEEKPTEGEDHLPQGGGNNEEATEVASDEEKQKGASDAKAIQESIFKAEENSTPGETVDKGNHSEGAESESKDIDSSAKEAPDNGKGSNDDSGFVAKDLEKSADQEAESNNTPASEAVTEQKAAPAQAQANVYTKGMPFDPQTLQVSAGLQMQWDSAPQRVAIIKKLMDADINDDFIDMVLWLQEKFPKLDVMIEAATVNELSMMKNPRVQSIVKACQILTENDDIGEKEIDLIISFGGDGTLLHAVSLFPQQLPPVLGFRKGSLNFLVPFKFETSTFPSILEDVWAGRVHVNLRTRIAYTLTSAVKGNLIEHTALNEIAVTRGTAPNLCLLDIFINEQKLAHVAGDGILISTSTGSTAYSLAAGGAVVHPLVPAIQIVPIAAHSICVRAIVVPCNTDVVLRLSDKCRSDAVVTSDGNQSFPMGKKDILHIKTSLYPVPLLHSAYNNHDGDWIKSFHWCQQLDAPGDVEVEESHSL